MSKLESIEIYVPEGSDFFGTEGDKVDGEIHPMEVEMGDGERFSRTEAYWEEGDETYLLYLTWLPRRAGKEKIPLTTLDGKEIDPTRHPLWGTKNEIAGVYHHTLPAGCYRLDSWDQVS
tara:strand:- start:7 stop:363 length:357 start_codon:yes stop_codon:yes gene_type:complete